MRKNSKLRLSVVLVAGSLVLPAAGPIPLGAQSVDESLVGVWGGETTLSTAVGGLLVVDGRMNPWLARIGGFQVPIERTQDSLRFALPDDAGRFRGYVDPDGSIVGHWIQPPLQTRGAAYATPVRLARRGRAEWKGHVHPMLDRLRLYFVVRKDSALGLSGFLRNPELNLGMGRPFHVARRGDDVQFRNVRDSTDVFEGSYDPAADRIVLRVPWLATPVLLTRRDSSTAPGFYPRTPMPSRYRYRQPVDIGDGWSTASLDAVGLDEAGVDSLVSGILQRPIDGYTAPYIHSLQVARHGRLVVDEYFFGYAVDDLHDTRSAGKSFAPLLVGIAGDLTRRIGPSTRLAALLGDYLPFENPDPRKLRITAGDLMSMTSGLACDDNDGASPGQEDRMQSQTEKPDWYRYAVDLPMAGDPGGNVAVYCTAGINLLGAMVRSVTGSWLPELFRQRVAEPLEFRGYHLNLMPTGEGYWGGGIFLHPRDLLKLGQLYLNGGVWREARVVRSDWVAASTTPRAYFDRDHGYGYGWHLRRFQVGDRSVSAFSAEGNGGQLLMVFPELDLVVLVMAGNYGNYPTWIRFQDLVAEHLLPAVEEVGHSGST